MCCFFWVPSLPKGNFVKLPLPFRPPTGQSAGVIICGARRAMHCKAAAEMAGWASSTYGPDLAIGTKMPRSARCGKNWRKTNWGTTKTNMNCDFFVEMFRVSKNWNYHVWNFPWEFLYINCFFAMTTSLMVNGWVPATAAVAKDSRHQRLEVQNVLRQRPWQAKRTE